jgi:hypothetical protein
MATIIAPVWRGCQWWRELEDAMINKPVPIGSNTYNFKGDFSVIPKPLHNKKWHWMAFWISGKDRPEDGHPEPGT